MKAIRGNTSNLAAFSNLLKSFSNFSESHKINSHGCSHLLKIRVFSSFNPPSRDGYGRRNDRNNFNVDRNDYDDNYSKFSGSNRGKFSAHQKIDDHGSNPNSGRQNVDLDRSNWRRGRRNDGFGKPIGGDREFRDRERGHLKLSDDFFKIDEVGEFDGKKDDQPSVRGPVNRNRPVMGEKRGEKRDDEFLEKFKLGGVGKDSKEESQSNEGHIGSPPRQEEGFEEEPEEAKEIFSKMKKNGLIPNAVAMLDGLCQDGLVHEAMKLFEVMREKGTIPEVVVYTAVVEGFFKAHKIDDATRIFKKMQDNGIVANAFSYTVLIDGLCKAKRLEDGIEFCVEMLDAGHSPNVATFTGLVHEVCKEKGVEDAQRVVGMLKKKGFLLDEKAVREHLDQTGPTSPMVWEAVFSPKKTT